VARQNVVWIPCEVSSKLLTVAALLLIDRHDRFFFQTLLKVFCFAYWDASAVTVFCLSVFVQDESQGTLHSAREQCAQQQASVPL